MYIDIAIERINSINWSMVGKIKSKSHSNYGYEYLRRLSHFFKNNSIDTLLVPLVSNIATLLGDTKGDIILSEYCSTETIDFLGADKRRKTIIEYYIQLARYSDENKEAAKYMSVYEPLIELLEIGGLFELSLYELEIIGVACFPLRGWYKSFIAKEPINI